ncbi:hypothetical protein bsdtb5_29540 [Anaeromicropila herbilytica]|uniref:Uncharacterized protein n=1 Tax=Anaeromicropila herbilytica TaxID=2785025 RepID=A0A7R7EMQ4_9FIRM|nr:hypothetical protein bsdtb5_29540 [Anaeromicropila herbilytica]
MDINSVTKIILTGRVSVFSNSTEHLIVIEWLIMEKDYSKIPINTTRKEVDYNDDY